MKANFLVDADGATKILRKPKVISALKWPARVQARQARAWGAKMSTRIAQATSLEEVMQIMREVDLRAAGIEP
jgi:hypothetical protein